MKRNDQQIIHICLLDYNQDKVTKSRMKPIFQIPKWRKKNFSYKKCYERRKNELFLHIIFILKSTKVDFVALI